MLTAFDAFFQADTGNAPYDYQCRLACGPDARADAPDTLKLGTACQPQLISIPTGLGKTAAVVLAWLWNRVHLPAHNSQLVTDNSTQWPLRLVYCLPMRTLVDQTEKEVRKWLGAHGLLWNEKESHAGKVGVHLLMGGEAAGHESYTRGVLRLLEHYGPFRLAYFEALFRAADIRASKKADGPQP